MFDFLLSTDRKLRKQAEHWLEMAGRIRDYRRDQLPVAQLQKLESAQGELRAKVREKASGLINFNDFSRCHCFFQSLFG